MSQAARTEFGWITPLPLSQLRADPSGVQDAGTVVQATLLPGMSTATGNVRYISLFAAARYYRMQAGEKVQASLPWAEHFRRLEALIAVSSVRHHRHDQRIPPGIIGRNAGVAMSQQAAITLRTNLRRPPYNIYRGTLASLGLNDLDEPSDPLRQGALALARAWDPSQAGVLGRMIQSGVLDDVVARDLVDETAGAFCLCSVPDGSAEQAELVGLLLGLGRSFEPPTFAEDVETTPLAYRAVAWRLVLEIVERSPGEAIAGDRLMARLLRPDLLRAPMPGAVHASLFAWRWVAARMFFERGWTLLFNRTLAALRLSSDGIDREELRGQMESDCGGELATDRVDAVSVDAERNWESSDWLGARYRGETRRDLLSLMAAGISAARADRSGSGPSVLTRLWTDGDIPFAVEHRRLDSWRQEGAPAARWWADVAEQTLVQHVRTSLQKMRDGNPDSLLIDFDQGRWLVPEKALDVHPFPAGGFSRLDVALGWAQQLGLVASQDSGLALTPFGREVRERWDAEHAG